MLTRRQLLTSGLMLGAGTLIPGSRSAEPVVSDPGVVLAPFVDPLPIPPVMPPRPGVIPGGHFYEIRMLEFKQKLHRDLPPTTLWGYEGLYPGPTIRALRNVPVFVRWVNALRDLTTGALRTTHYLPSDLCLHGPDHFGNVPHTVVHLHGGRVPPESDGHPNATIAPGQRVTYHYPNAQRGMTLWYHDHAWGITRLNVYMGLAGFYLIDDPGVEGPLNLPSGQFDVPLVIQDRAFKTDGSLKYTLLPWEQTFLGDHVLVNGKVTPFFNVSRGKYRFRVLNGSNARNYTLSLFGMGSTHQMTQIGTDGGLIKTPAPLSEITLAPAERAELVVDFEPFGNGSILTLRNSALAPAGPVIQDVMQFRVGATTGHTVPLPGSFSTVQIDPLPDAGVLTRQIALTVEIGPQFCNGFRFSFNNLGWNDITEEPKLGDIEIWEFTNNIGEMHPIHLHLVNFQVMGAQPLAWKDTVQVPPGPTSTKIIMRFERYTGQYAYHCHILEHEDHEMMRQFRVLPP